MHLRRRKRKKILSSLRFDVYNLSCFALNFDGDEYDFSIKVKVVHDLCV